MVCNFLLRDPRGERGIKARQVERSQEAVEQCHLADDGPIKREVAEARDVKQITGGCPHAERPERLARDFVDGQAGHANPLPGDLERATRPLDTP